MARQIEVPSPGLTPVSFTDRAEAWRMSAEVLRLGLIAAVAAAASAGGTRALQTATGGTHVFSLTPTSRFRVELCSQIAGLSGRKRSVLTAWDAQARCVNAFGLLVAAKADCKCDSNMLLAANYFAQNVDTDGDGTIDLVADLAKHVSSFDGTDNKKPVILCGKDSASEVITSDAAEQYLGPTLPSQAHKGRAASKSEAQSDEAIRSILKEEVFHATQQFLWARAYPAEFGYDPGFGATAWGSVMCRSLKQAQCVWWQHPENVGCRDMAGTQCTSAAATTLCTSAPVAETTGTCAEYNVRGQCYPNPVTCAGPSCDCIEFYHKLHMCFIMDPSCYVYERAMASGGFPRERNESTKAAYKAAVQTQLAKTTEGTALLRVLQASASGVYKLPSRPYTDAYTATGATQAPVNCTLGPIQVSNCTRSCGDGGSQFRFRSVVVLPRNSGASCPVVPINVSTCPAAVAAGFPACSARDPCTAPFPSCWATGPSATVCSRCARGRPCTSTAACSDGLACRARGGGSGQTFCLSQDSAGAPVPPEEAVPDLSSVAAGTAASAPTVASRQPLPTDRARGVVLQLPMQLPGPAVLAPPSALEAVRSSLQRLVTGLGVPANATVTIDLVFGGPRTPSSPGGSAGGGPPGQPGGGGPPGRGLQFPTLSLSTTVSIGVRLPASGPGASVEQAAALGTTLATELSASAAAVASAVSAALAGAGSAVAGGRILVDGTPLFAVVAASDGAVVAGSPSVMAALRAVPAASPSESPSPGPAASDEAAAQEALSVVVIAAVGGGLAVVLVLAASVVAWRTGCGPKRSPVSPSGGSQHDGRGPGLIASSGTSPSGGKAQP